MHPRCARNRKAETRFFSGQAQQHAGVRLGPVSVRAEGIVSVYSRLNESVFSSKNAMDLKSLSPHSRLCTSPHHIKSCAKFRQQLRSVEIDGRTDDGRTREAILGGAKFLVPGIYEEFLSPVTDIWKQWKLGIPGRVGN